MVLIYPFFKTGDICNRHMNVERADMESAPTGAFYA